MEERNYDVLLLRPHEITDVIDIAKAIDLVEQGYREAQDFPLINAPRRRVHSHRNVRISSFPGGVDGLGVIGSLTRGERVTLDTTEQGYPYREHPVYLLWNSQTAVLQCIMIGEIAERRVGLSSLMALRTAATSGVGFRHLVRRNARMAGLYGSGGQALHKVLALQNERAIETYKVFSRNADNRERFCARMAKLIDAEFVPVDSASEVMRGTDVVICATNSNVPVFDGAWIEPGQHIVTVVGSNSALVQGGWLNEGRRESDDETARRADFIIANWRESVLSERQAGLYGPVERGVISWDKIHDLGEILNGTFAGRTDDAQITFHANNNGTAAADLAIAQWVYTQCKQMGRGTPIELSRPVQKRGPG
jgi:ornithine cyclodeaminase/alanine dehydrogenase-like protein (mu-crystallin family)